MTSIWDVIQCVKVITSDPDLHLVRIKNRLSPVFNTLGTAGYRDVSMNFRIVNAETMRWGLDTHVCEVQLVPFEIAAVMSDEAHARYVKFRDTQV